MSISNENKHAEGSADRLTADGYLFLHDFCSSGFLQQIMDVSHQRIDEVQAALGEREIGIGSAAGFDEIVQRSPGRWDLPITPEQLGTTSRELPWWPLVAEILGDDAEHFFSGVVFSEPGSPAQFWHIDSPHQDARHLPAHALNVLVALHDIPLEMGPTELSRGSHVLTNHLANPSLVADELIYQHAGTSPRTLVQGTENELPETSVRALTAGSCLVFDDRILHRGLANGSDQPRYVAYFSYRQKGYSENTHFEAHRSVFDAELRTGTK